MSKFPNLAIGIDLETRSLDAVSASMIVCAVMKPYGEEPIVLRFDTLGDKVGRERKLVKGILDTIFQYPIWYGHNIEKFDWPMLFSRAKLLGIECPRISNVIYDTMQAFGRTGFRTRLNMIGKPTKALGHAIDFYRIPQQKDGVFPVAWNDAVENDNEVARAQALDAIVKHCVADVAMLEALFEEVLLDDTKARFVRSIH